MIELTWAESIAPPRYVPRLVFVISFWKAFPLPARRPAPCPRKCALGPKASHELSASSALSKVILDASTRWKGVPGALRLAARLPRWQRGISTAEPQVPPPPPPHRCRRRCRRRSRRRRRRRRSRRSRRSRRVVRVVLGGAGFAAGGCRRRRCRRRCRHRRRHRRRRIAVAVGPSRRRRSHRPCRGLAAEY